MCKIMSEECVYQNFHDTCYEIYMKRNKKNLWKIESHLSQGGALF